MTVRQFTRSIRNTMAGLLAAASSLAGAGLGLPEPGRTPDNVVPFDVVREVAQNRVAGVWPGSAPGPVISYQDYDGATTAYMFHFRVDGKPFPADYDQVAREGREDVDRFQAALARAQQEERAITTTPPSGFFRYAHVLVSARDDRSPELAWGEGLSEYFRTGAKAQAQASGLLGPASELKRVYYLWPTPYFEFLGNGRSVVMNANLVTQVQGSAEFIARCRADMVQREQEIVQRLAKQGRTPAEYQQERRAACAQEWQRARKGPQDPAPAYLPYHYKTPFYDWGFGCSPTAGAMIFGYLDDVCNHGRLIDWHCQRWDAVQGETDYNTPNAQLELAVTMGTDTMAGSTPWDNIGPGLYDAITRLNSYTCGGWVRYYHWDTENWCWDEAVGFLDGGCPVEWGMHPCGNTSHSVAIFGRDQSNGHFWVHNTWSPPGEWWHYTGGGGYDYTQIDCCVPLAQANTHVKLYYPTPDTHYNCNGHGMTVYAWTTVPVISSATAGDSWHLQYSMNGGKPGSWIPWERGTGHPATIYVDFDASMVSDSARFRLVIYTAGQNSPYAASDGSWGNFRVIAVAPPAPVLAWPHNNGIIGCRYSAICPGLYVDPIAYAQQYWFRFYNDSLADTVESGWQADTVWHVSEGCPVGSHGWWQARARNPTGESPWSIRASYQIVRDSSWRPKRKPMMLTKKKPKKGGCVMKKKKKKYMHLTTTDDTLYLLVGNSTREFQRYSVWNDDWSQACSLPAGPKKKKVKAGAGLLSDTTFVYAFKGGGTNEFYRYDPGADAWTELIGPTFVKGLKNGFSALVESGGQDYIYCGSGASNNEWLRYNVGTGAWEAPDAGLPVVKAKAGSGFAWDDSSTLYFLAGGSKENDFYAYHLDLGTWSKLAGLPLAGPTTRKKKVKEGGAIEWFQGKVYAVKGGGTFEFWSYDPLVDRWVYVCEVGEGSSEPLVKGIKCADPLTATDEGIYCIIGNNTDEFFFWPGDTTHGEVFGPSGGGATSGSGAGVRTTGLFVSPNPFSSSRSSLVSYSLPAAGMVSLRLYDVTGKLVGTLVNGYRPAGEYSLRLTANGSRRKLTAGVYVLRLDRDNELTTEKLVIE